MFNYNKILEKISWIFGIIIVIGIFFVVSDKLLLQNDNKKSEKNNIFSEIIDDENMPDGFDSSINNDNHTDSNGSSSTTKPSDKNDMSDTTKPSDTNDKSDTTKPSDKNDMSDTTKPSNITDSSEASNPSGTNTQTGSKPSNNANKPASVLPSNIILSTTSISVRTTNTVRVSATVEPSNAVDKTVTWTSSNTEVATVSSDGTITGNSAGTAVISAKTNNGVKSDVIVTVISQERIHFISHDESTNANPHITGDAILLESNGHFAMIDLGHKDKFTNVLTYLRSNNVNRLDFVLFTHMDPDHAGNFENLSNNVSIANIWMQQYDSSNESKSLSRYSVIKNVANSKNINLKNLSLHGEGHNYTFKYLKFGLAVYNLGKSSKKASDDNYNSLVTLYEVNGHKVLLTGDIYDTDVLNSIGRSVGKIGIFKVPHHGSRFCALLPINQSTALSSLNPKYYVVTSSRKKLEYIRSNYNDRGLGLCVDAIPKGKDVFYVDESKNAFVIDLTESNLKFYS